MGGYLHNEVGGVCINHLPRHSLQFQYIRSSVTCRVVLCPEAVVNRTYYSRVMTGSLEDRFYQIAGGGFSIGTSDSYHRELLGRASVEAIGNVG